MANEGREVTEGAVKIALRAATKLTMARLPQREELRLAQLRAYAFAVATTLEGHVEMGALKKEELVAVLAASALFLATKEASNA